MRARLLVMMVGWVALGCGKDSAGGAAADGPKGATAAPLEAPGPAKPKSLDVVWDGGKPSGEAITVRVVSLIGKDAERRAVDVWTVDAKTQRWLRLVKAQPYGTVSEPVAVPKIFGGARLFFLAPDEAPGDPYKRVTASADVSWPEESPHKDGPFTLIVRDERDAISSQVINDAEVRAPKSEQAKIQLRTVLAWAGVPSLELSLGEGRCLDPNRIINEALAEVPPGSVTPVVHNANDAGNCQGPKLAGLEPMTLAAGEVVVLVLGGRSDKDAVLVPVRL